MLVATIFDAFQRIYRFRTRDLLRIATNGTGVLPGRQHQPRPGAAASPARRREIAEHLLHICIRALDYSPPNDITFGSYLRALITADLDIAPEDESGYRVALIEAFRARGIFPEPRQHAVGREPAAGSGRSFSPQEERRAALDCRHACRQHIRLLVETADRPSWRSARGAPQARCTSCWRGSGGPRHRRVGAVPQQARADRAPGVAALRHALVTIGSCASTGRIGARAADRGAHRPAGLPRRPRGAADRAGARHADAAGGRGHRPAGESRGRWSSAAAASLVLSLGNLNTVDYVIVKNIKSYERFAAQVAYLNGETDGGAAAASTYAATIGWPRIEFNLLHRF